MYFEKRAPLMLDLGYRAENIARLKSYVDLLWASNEKLNLISRKMTFEELIDNHVIDCLLPLKSFPKGVKVVADFGAGGGLPGVVYAIQFPEIRFKLFEKSHLKQDFLSLCQDIAPNLEIHGDIPIDLKDVELVIARAFKPIDVILQMSRAYHTRGGKYFLLKARREKIEEELGEARKKVKNLKAEVLPLMSPILDVERHLVLI